MYGKKVRARGATGWLRDDGSAPLGFRSHIECQNETKEPPLDFIASMQPTSMGDIAVFMMKAGASFEKIARS